MINEKDMELETLLAEANLEIIDLDQTTELP